MRNDTEREFQRKFTGNTILYRDIRLHRSPVVLQRNIKSFLDFNQRKLNARTAYSCVKKNMNHLNGAAHGPANLQERNRSTWNIKDLQRSLANNEFKHDVPSLRIEIKGVRDKREKLKRSLPDSEPPLKRLKTTDIRAQCSLTIFDSRSPKKQGIVRQTKQCMIRICNSQLTHSATVHMDEPFLVSANELLMDASSTKTDKPLIGEAYKMQVSVLASASLSDPWPPFQIRQAPKVTQVVEFGEITRLPILSAEWKKLPECPPPGFPLPVYAFQDQKPYKSKLVFDIDAMWSSSTSPLAAHNTALKDETSSVPHLPTPVSESEPSGAIVVVRWAIGGTWQDLKDVDFDGYFCPLCNRLEFKNLDAYHFHLINSHDLFKFKLICEATSTDTGQQHMKVEVKVDVVDSYRARAASHLPDDREMLWERPKSLFDIEAYLLGDESWLGRKSTIGRNARHVVLSGTQQPDDHPTRETAKSSNPIFVEPRSPNAVPDLPVANRLRHKVPSAPAGIQYFRSTVKRALKEGEWLTESDDEIDESWLLQKHEDTVESFRDVSDPEKEFIKRYDSHMLRENLSSNVHLSEALVRFCRLNRRFIKRKDMMIEFHKNAATLILHQVIKPSVVRACVQIIHEKEENLENGAMELGAEADLSQNQISRGTEKTSVHGNEPSDRMVSPADDTQSPSDFGHEFGKCCCGGRIHNMRTSIRCSNTTCISPDHHLRCVGLAHRLPGWICKTCSLRKPLPMEQSRPEGAVSVAPIRTKGPISRVTAGHNGVGSIGKIIKTNGYRETDPAFHSLLGDPDFASDISDLSSLADSDAMSLDVKVEVVKRRRGRPRKHPLKDGCNQRTKVKPAAKQIPRTRDTGLDPVKLCSLCDDRLSGEAEALTCTTCGKMRHTNCIGAENKAIGDNPGHRFCPMCLHQGLSIG